LRVEKTKKIFFIPGMWSSGDVFSEYLQFASKRGYEGEVAELYRGQEDKFAGLGRIGLSDYVEQVGRDINILSRGKKYFVLGHSLGGLIAMIAASRKIIQPEAMVLLIPAAPRGIPSMTISVMRSFSQIFAKTLWRREQASISFAKACYAFFELVPICHRWRIFQNFVPESSRVIEEVGLWFFDKTKSSEVIGQNISCNVLVIAATQDRIIPAKVVKKTFRKLDREVPIGFRVDYREFPHAHWILSEPGWEEVIGFILSWLEEDFSPSS